MRESTQRGAEGLFNVILSSLSGISEDIIKTKFAGITTDGESVNKGRLSGLWAKLEQYVGHETFNVWCTCHRSDLAMEDIFHCVPELEHWQSKLSSLATFYRVSGLRTEELRNILPEMVTFPRHHEVRFAQHLLQLVLAAIKTLPDPASIGKNSQMRLVECMTKRKKPSAQYFLECGNHFV